MLENNFRCALDVCDDCPIEDKDDDVGGGVVLGVTNLLIRGDCAGKPELEGFKDTNKNKQNMSIFFSKKN
jgi:hypothetical protein